ncbi:hypothetical protein IAI10_02720 [Clostridium sp. 19966]|uniref:hypothetical protein n=1 Tax=Clostridium sp. 19966 TaxID=2768166 RepID=UPI0028DEEE23|nr:hypothetical protein [Clostridium sp. 19966]MDT8715572.1 hypothetical protein [Clostridium sp. 19966]
MISYIDSTQKQKEFLIKSIFQWDRSKARVLNIKTVPYNESNIFIDIIMEYITSRKKVLYVCNEKKGFETLQKSLRQKEMSDCFSEGDIDQINLDAPLNMVLTEQLLEASVKYDLVIYDDAVAYSKYSKFEILDLLGKFYKSKIKIICRSMETIFQNAPVIDMPIGANGMPIPEPRIITTRVDLEHEIPSMIYEYIDWSLLSGKNVMIFVPNEDTAQNLSVYLENFKDSLCSNIHKFIKGVKVSSIKKCMASDKVILVTDSIESLSLASKDTDFIVYSTEDKIYDYKMLTYICSKTCNPDSIKLGEVIFLSKDVSRDMENCKEIIRGFNKLAWEKGLLYI